MGGGQTTRSLSLLPDFLVVGGKGEAVPLQGSHEEGLGAGEGLLLGRGEGAGGEVGEGEGHDEGEAARGLSLLLELSAEGVLVDGATRLGLEAKRGEVGGCGALGFAGGGGFEFGHGTRSEGGRLGLGGLVGRRRPTGGGPPRRLVLGLGGFEFGLDGGARFVLGLGGIEFGLDGGARFVLGLGGFKFGHGTRLELLLEFQFVGMRKEGMMGRIRGAAIILREIFKRRWGGEDDAIVRFGC